jgi:hypothetical protein
MNDMDKIKALRNALDDIVELCDNDDIRTKIKLTLIETNARLALTLHQEENNVYE